MRGGTSVFFKKALGAVRVEALQDDGTTQGFSAYLDSGEQIYALGTDFDLQTQDCVLTCQSCDAVGLIKGSTVFVGENSYSVEHVLPDGAGISKVILSNGAVSYC